MTPLEQRKILDDLLILETVDVLDLSTDSEHRRRLEHAYEVILPIVEGLQLKKLKPKDFDKRLLEAVRYGVIPYVEVVYFHSEEYWENIQKYSDHTLFPEIQIRKIRTKDLRDTWKRLYSRKRKPSLEDAEDTQE